MGHFIYKRRDHFKDLFLAPLQEVVPPFAERSNPECQFFAHAMSASKPRCCYSATKLTASDVTEMPVSAAEFGELSTEIDSIPSFVPHVVSIVRIRGEGFQLANQ